MDLITSVLTANASMLIRPMLGAAPWAAALNQAEAEHMAEAIAETTRQIKTTANNKAATQAEIAETEHLSHSIVAVRLFTAVPVLILAFNAYRVARKIHCRMTRISPDALVAARAPLEQFATTADACQAVTL